MLKYEKLRIDGTVGELYDVDAVHNDDFSDILSEALVTNTIKGVLLDLIFPIGSYYMTSSSTNPSNILGGTWRAVEGRFLLGASSSYAVDSTGGSKDAVVVSHDHTASGSTGSAGAHSHTISGTAANAGWHGHPGNGWTFSVYKGTRETETVGELGGSGWDMTQVKKGGSWSGYADIPGSGSHTHSVSGSTNSTGNHTHTVSVSVAANGSAGTDKNMPPYKAAYIWERIS